MAKVAVVILNHNGQQYLEKFLPAIVRYSEGQVIVVVDNASTDQSAKLINEKFEGVRLIELANNNGYAGGYNESLKLIDSEYYVLLNSDVQVTENWINPVIKLMDSDPSITACQPKILSYKQKDRFEYAGASGGFIDFLGYPFCRGRIFNTTERDDGQYDNTRQIFWASGACFFVKSKVFYQLGGFDEDFFAHMEEIDLCWRMNNLGLKVMVCPESTIYHVGAGTLPVSNPRKTYLNFTNNLAILTKNLSFNKLFFILPIRILLDWIAALKFLVDGTTNHSFAILKAHFEFVGKFRIHLRKRTRGQKAISKALVLNKSVVAAYFLQRKKGFNDMKF
ncbi:MAG: glycosyltransferase family 2 protein [Bacteroidetes bacterium]|nr:glycosyltransferase family 2 protein [Bacteroidota bacterium]